MDVSLFQYLTMRPKTILNVSQVSNTVSVIILDVITEQCFIRSIMHVAADYLGLYHNDVMCTIYLCKVC